MERFWCIGKEGWVTIKTVDIEGREVILFVLSSREEAETICVNLNKSISELLDSKS